MRLSDELTGLSQQWGVSIAKTVETDTSLLAFGVRGHSPVVLKVNKQKGDEWNSGEVLRSFNGHGMVRLYESGPGAVLLERLEPGNDLATLVRDGNDDRATEIFAEVMSEMANHSAPNGCHSVLDWACGFDRYLRTHDQRVPVGLVNEASQLYRKLSASSSTTMLLHGDLHHYNVVFDTKRGWVAIDPKGVVGELEYEVGAVIRNPVELPEFYTSPAVVERRLRILSDALQLDYGRALQWSFAQAVLSAIWDVEDGVEVEPKHPALRLAQAIQGMLRS